MQNSTVEEIIKNKYKDKPYLDIYKDYKSAGGVTKAILRNMMIKKLMYGEDLIEFNDLKEIIDNAEIEAVWNLASNAKSDIVRDISMEKLDTYIENKDNYMMEKKKIKDKTLKKQLKLKYGGNV